MSGTFPADPSPATVDLDSKQAVTVTRSWSGKRQSRISGGHLWAASLTWSKMPRYMLAPIFGFVGKQRGRHGSFKIVLPNFATPNGVATGSPKVLNNHSKGVSVIVTDGWTSAVTGIMKSGDVLKFASHDKVYMMQQDVDSVGGVSALYIDPPLIQDILDNEDITVNDVEFTMSLDGDVTKWKGSAPNLAVISLDMTESL